MGIPQQSRYLAELGVGLCRMIFAPTLLPIPARHDTLNPEDGQALHCAAEVADLQNEVYS